MEKKVSVKKVNVAFDESLKLLNCICCIDIPVVLLGLPLEPDLVALLLAVLLHVLLGALEHLLPLGVRGLEMIVRNIKLRRLVRGDTSKETTKFNRFST